MAEVEQHNDVHEAFAESRSREYVYVPGDEECFQKLDQHAETIEGDAKLPFVILGGPGCGKSALLANWVQRRKQHKHRDEFLFQHFVGCSPKSKQLEHLLFRLETSLKDFFQLREMEVPNSEERLRWSLSRFLYSAAKKHCPARIVIVLDGVNKLLGQSAAADAMHWLPTELQPGVRFILSTGEFDRYTSSGAEPPEGQRRLHRTWTELKRRNCPYLRMEPLTMDVRHSIIEAFVDKFTDTLQLNSTQRFQIATAAASSQPMFLRTVLFALRLGAEMSTASTNDQIDACLAADSTGELISKVFDLCSGYIEGEDEGEGQSILCRVLSVLYASRHGLSDEEIRGSVEMAMGSQIPENLLESIARILKDFTMTVDGLRMFSHEDYSNAVYEKYIQTPELNIRLHLLMARYFGRLAPCDRKLDSLPYHLEVSGSWSKLRGALVSVEMFELWWTPRHKTEFISLWASLTDCDNPKTPIRKLVSGEFNSTMRCNQPPRPCYDIVEEYVKSVDEYRYAKNPSSEELAGVILKVADFLLELATLSLEEQADVPQFIHPTVPKEDLAALGVPFLDTDEEGRSVLRTPVIEGESSTLHKPVVDAPAKLNEEVPVCSTYFYHRWMWIQFPWVALSNCGDKYTKGIEYTQSLKPPSLRKAETTPTVRGGASTPGTRRAPRSKDRGGGGRGDAASLTESLPEIRAGGKRREFMKRASMTTPKRRDDGESTEDVAETQWADKVKALRSTISNSRFELDHMSGERAALVRRIAELQDELVDLQRMEESTTDLEERKDSLDRRFAKLEEDKARTAVLHQNYLAVLRMCERHPAHSSALIEELERKLEIDEKFIDAVRQRLHKEKFEQHMYCIQKKYMSKSIGEASILQHDMLTERQRQATNLRRLGEMELSQPAPGHFGSPAGEGGGSTLGTHRGGRTLRKTRSNTLRSQQGDNDNQALQVVARWEDYQARIHQRTGISDPAVFFQKFLGQDELEAQMQKMQEAADRRHGKLKGDEVRVEQELEEARYEAQAAGMNFGEVRKKQELLSKLQFQHKHVKERAEAMERLSQGAVSGLKHVCETLGMPPLEPETPISDLIQAIDGLLDTLMEEKDRAQQKTSMEGPSRPVTQHKQPSKGGGQRTSELSAALAHFETPKQRVAARLQGRVGQDHEPAEGAAARPEVDEELLMYRKEVKGAAMKSLKEEKRRQAKLEMKKQAALKAQMED